MPHQPSWKGYLKLSLVSASIAIYPATSASGKVHFHMLNRATGNRLKRQMADSVTGELVDSAEIAKGYEIAKNEYITVGGEEIAGIAIESTRMVDIEKFVPRESIDERYRDAAYYLAPDDKVGQEAFAVIRDSMRKMGMAGIARVVMARRERVMMLEPFGKGMLGTTLFYPYEVRSEAPVFAEIPDLEIPSPMLMLAEEIIGRMKGDFDPSAFEDRYEKALIELIRTKQEGMPPRTAAVPSRPANVVDLMEALRRSVQESGKEGRANLSRERASGRAPAPRRRIKRAG